MIYTALTKKAMLLAYTAHKDQKDKGGMPYIFHPFFVAEHMDTETETAAALLHDVCEDTPITANDLKNMGFPTEVVSVVDILSRKENEDYTEYIKLVKQNPTAAKIKLWDLRHNSMISRIENPTEKDFERLKKYANAQNILNN